jgi:hypothetical protein
MSRVQPKAADGEPLIVEPLMANMRAAIEFHLSRLTPALRDKHQSVTEVHDVKIRLEDGAEKFISLRKTNGRLERPRISSTPLSLCDKRHPDGWVSGCSQFSRVVLDQAETESVGMRSRFLIF